MDLTQLISNQQIPRYYKNALLSLSQKASLNSAAVLEIGGSSLPASLISALGVASWLSVDILDHQSGSYQRRDENLVHALNSHQASPRDTLDKSQYSIVNGDVLHLSHEFDEQFDIVFSVNCFEHISDLISLAWRIKSFLRPTGVLYSEFGPIWSGPNGSHFWGRDGWDFLNPGPIQEYDHLLLRPSDIYSKAIRNGFSHSEASYATYEIFTSPKINRLFASDYHQIFKDPGYSFLEIKPGYERTVEAAELEKLISRYPFNNDFSSYTLTIYAKK